MAAWVKMLYGINLQTTKFSRERSELRQAMLDQTLRSWLEGSLIWQRSDLSNGKQQKLSYNVVLGITELNFSAASNFSAAVTSMLWKSIRTCWSSRVLIFRLNSKTQWQAFLWLYGRYVCQPRSQDLYLGTPRGTNMAPLYTKLMMNLGETLLQIMREWNNRTDLNLDKVVYCNRR